MTALKQLPFAKPYLVVTVAVMALFFPTWLRLAQEWLKWEQSLAHGLLTFLIYLGLLLFHPPKPAPQPTTSTPRARITIAGGLSLIATVLAWAVLELVRIDTLAYLMLPVGIVVATWSMLGMRAAFAILPYSVLFALSIPIWNDLIPFLVQLASVVVGNFVQWFGMTALIEGSNITLPYGRLVISDGCSGIRYFAISILLAVMTSILNDYRWKGWLLTVAVGMMIGLLANWVRIAGLVVIAYQTNMESSLITSHETYGWLIYAAFVIPAMLVAPIRRRGESVKNVRLQMAPKSLWLFLGAVLIGPLGITVAHSNVIEQPAWSLRTDAQLSPSRDRMPIPLILPDRLNHQIWQTGHETWVTLAQSQRGVADEKLVPYLPRAVSDEQWYLESAHHNGQIRIYRNIHTRKQVAFSQWYQVGNYRTDNYRKAKLLQVPATLLGQTRFALITLQANCGSPSCSKAVRALIQLNQGIHLEPEF